MEMKKGLAAFLVLAASAPVSAFGLSGGMQPGVASAEGARAVFVNPALLSAHDGHLIDILAPRIKFEYNDTDDVIGQASDIADFVDDAGVKDLAFMNDLGAQLDTLAESNRVTANLGIQAAAATSLPFGVGVGAFLDTNTTATSLMNLGTGSNEYDKYLNTEMDVLTVSSVELGVSAAYEFGMPVGDLSVGISPKIQMLKVFGDTLALDDYSLSSFGDDEFDSTTFNVDLGAAYTFGPLTVGVAGKNLVPHQLDVNLAGRDYTAQSPTMVVAGLGFDGGLFQLGLDAELTEYSVIDGQDGTQKIAVSGDAVLLPMLLARGAVSYDVLQEKMGYTVGVGVNLIPRTQIDFDAGISEDGDMSVMAGINIYL